MGVCVVCDACFVSLCAGGPKISFGVLLHERNLKRVSNVVSSR